MVGKDLIKPALVLSLPLQVVQMLHQEIAHRVGWLEFEREHAPSGENAQQHLDAVAHLAYACLLFAHAVLDPGGYMPVARKIVSSASLGPFTFTARSFIDPFRDRGEGR